MQVFLHEYHSHEISIKLSLMVFRDLSLIIERLGEFCKGGGGMRRGGGASQVLPLQKVEASV